MSAQTVQKAFVHLPGGSVAVYNSNGLAYYRHPDWLGSSRLASTPNRAIYSTTAYGPFGETYASTGTTDLSFTGMNQDTVANLYDFPTREYGIQGRWPSPDPAGLSAVSLRDPQTFNRYAYVSNRPLNTIDPWGLRQCLNPGSGGCHDGGGGGGGGGLGTSAGCVVDGVPLTCDGAITVLLSNGVALICPGNNCKQVRMGADGNWEILVPADPGMNGYPCGVGKTCTWAAHDALWVNVTWILIQQQTQEASQLSQAPTPQQYLQAISIAVAPLNKLADCAAMAAADQVPFGIGNKLIGAPRGGSDPVGTGLSIAGGMSNNKASAVAVLSLNKAGLPALSEAVENGATRVVSQLAPYADLIKGFSGVSAGARAAYHTYTCYNKP
jgi:RHS repeat-associated protein